MLNCNAANCVHNTGGSCSASVIQVKRGEDQHTCCHTYNEIPLDQTPNDMEKMHQKQGAFRFIMGDGEYSSEFFGDGKVACSASNCLYNIHYECKAKTLTIKGEDCRAICNTYYPL